MHFQLLSRELSILLPIMAVRLAEQEWGTIESFGTIHGTFGVEYGSSPTWEGPAEQYAIIGFNLPEPFYAEIEDGDWGSLNGFRIWRKDLP